MISCEEASIICNKKQYKEATFLEKIRLKLHILICKVCAKATKNNTKLSQLCKKADLNVLSQKEKEKMKQELNA